MTGGKIEYPALTAIPAAAAAKHLAALSGGEKHLLVRLRNFEIFPVGFVLRDDKKFTV